MANQGTASEFVNSSKISLENDSDSDTIYIQMTDVSWKIVSDVTYEQNQDDVLDPQFDLTHFQITGNITVTTPEEVSLAALTVQTTNLPPAKTWVIKGTADSDRIDAGGTESFFTVTDSMYLQEFETIDRGIGYATCRILLISADGIPTFALQAATAEP